MKRHVIWIVAAGTAALGIVFMIPSGPRAATAYEPLAGRAWALTGTAPQADTSTMTVAEVPVSTEVARPAVAAVSPRVVPTRVAREFSPPLPAVQAAAQPEKPREVAGSQPARTGQPHHRPQLQAAAKPDIAQSSATVAAAAPRAAATAAGVPQYALEDVADRYEADESKFPLDRTVTTAGVTLGLLGLERLERWFVLKVAVANAGKADFFVKGFTVAAASQDLDSRAIFRILVEPRRAREGYVLFVKPPVGADVHIKLQEDEGKGRALDVAIPYPF